jgi:hypothetical protein
LSGLKQVTRVGTNFGHGLKIAVLADPGKEKYEQDKTSNYADLLIGRASELSCIQIIKSTLEYENGKSDD